MEIVKTTGLNNLSRAAKNRKLKQRCIDRKVSTGPQLWVSCLLNAKGALSTNRIWEEYTRDSKVDKELIPTKSYLKNSVLGKMVLNGKI